MPITVVLAGDTMLGRGVADRLAARPAQTLFSAEVRDIFAAADLRLLNLECCISSRGERWDSAGKRFFFRAPPQAVEALAWLGVDCVTSANNHALDFGFVALADTLELLNQAGIAVVGAGQNQARARDPAILDVAGTRVAVLGVADHPADFAAGADRPGTAYADLSSGVPGWLAIQISQVRQAVDAVLVMPHWGPNMIAAPLRYVQRAAAELEAAGASLVAGSSAHVFQGVAGRILFDMGDFIDDYAVDHVLRNDLGLLFQVTLDEHRVTEIAAVPLVLEFCHTRLAEGADHAWIRDRFGAACAEFGTRVHERDGWLVAEPA